MTVYDYVRNKEGPQYVSTTFAGARTTITSVSQTALQRRISGLNGRYDLPGVRCRSLRGGRNEPDGRVGLANGCLLRIRQRRLWRA